MIVDQLTKEKNLLLEQVATLKAAMIKVGDKEPGLQKELFEKYKNLRVKLNKVRARLYVEREKLE